MKALALLLALAHPVLAGGLKWETSAQRLEAGPHDRSVRAEFFCRNTAKTPVKIESVRGVCVCCTGASATRKLLKPGERGSVVVKVLLEKRQFPVVKPVTVKTDDGQTAVLLVEVVQAKQ